MSKEHVNDALAQLIEQLSKLDDCDEITLGDLLSPEFLAQCSSFSDIEQFFNASGFTVESAEDFAAIPEPEWNAFIQAHTCFSSWDELQHSALKAYVERRLFD
ncbi:hypothetical protein KUV89_18020 [Marinobacter hydrocarbonoclasticus]|nr:hypothetical protein [Marinobacter nauticus]